MTWFSDSICRCRYKRIPAGFPVCFGHQQPLSGHGFQEFRAGQDRRTGFVDIRPPGEVQGVYLLHNPFGLFVIVRDSGADEDGFHRIPYFRYFCYQVAARMLGTRPP